jgi:hypothetical protein
MDHTKLFTVYTSKLEPKMRLRLTPTEIRRRAVRAAAAAAGLSVFACSDAATSTNGTVDVAAIDSSSSDVAAADSTVDSAAADSAANDATASDTAIAADAAKSDTTTTDTASTDTASTDTASTDTASTDTAKVDVAADDVAQADVADGQGCPPLGVGEPDCTDQNSPEWGTCCQEHQKWCTAAFPVDMEAANTCQFGENFSGTCTGCIPWGPPAPPAFELAWRPQVVANGVVFEVV